MSDDKLPSVLRIYETARTTHLERMLNDPTIELLYRQANYDFDYSIAQRVRATRVRRWDLVSRLLRTRAAVVEVNEPCFVAAWPTLAVVYATCLWRRVLRRGHRIAIVTYAIDNADPTAWISARLRLPERVSRALVRFVVTLQLVMLSRIAFGTSQARANLEGLCFGSMENRLEAAEFPAVSPACSSCDLSPKRGPEVIFVGTLDARKGVRDLLASWPMVLEAVPSARLVVLGKGPLESEVRARIDELRRARLIINPSRPVVHEELARARVLVLLSKRTRGWREQIGLPILEGLSHGCVIVTTTETGLAETLAAWGHQVLGDRGLDSVSAAIVQALDGPRAPAVLEKLPASDPRQEAHEWLAASSSHPARPNFEEAR